MLTEGKRSLKKIVVYFLNPQGQPQKVPVLAPVKNRKSMVWATYGPNLVLLEESEPNSSHSALTSLTIATKSRAGSFSSVSSVRHDKINAREVIVYQFSSQLHILCSSPFTCSDLIKLPQSKGHLFRHFHSAHITSTTLLIP